MWRVGCRAKRWVSRGARLLCFSVLACVVGGVALAVVGARNRGEFYIRILRIPPMWVKRRLAQPRSPHGDVREHSFKSFQTLTVPPGGEETINGRCAASIRERKSSPPCLPLPPFSRHGALRRCPRVLQLTSLDCLPHSVRHHTKHDDRATLSRGKASSSNLRAAAAEAAAQSRLLHHPRGGRHRCARRRAR